MNLEGRVTIDVRRTADAPDVRVAFSQPGRIDHLLRGKTPQAAMEIVPAVFSLCAMAQTQAARNALDAATGLTRSAAVLAARQCMTEMESLRENALRIAIDWPRFLGEAVDARHLKPLMRLVPDLRTALPETSLSPSSETSAHPHNQGSRDVIDRAEMLLQDLVFAEPLNVWRDRCDSAAVASWQVASRTSAARLLARISDAGWEDAGATPVIPLQPLDENAVRSWMKDKEADGAQLPPGTPAEAPETTLVARHLDDQRLAGDGSHATRGYGLRGRLMARLVELSMLPDRMRQLIDGCVPPARGRTLGANVGLAEVSAARGLLVHVAVLESGRIENYRILPPTRWNFAANGVAARMLRRIASARDGDMHLLAEMTVNAIDPCVGHTVRVH